MAKQITKKQLFNAYHRIVTGQDAPKKSERTKPTVESTGDKLERSVVDEIRMIIKNMGGLYLNITPGPLFSGMGVRVQNIKPGTADIIAAIPSTQGKYHIFIAVETKKRTGGTLHEEQMNFRYYCRQHNIMYMVAHSGNEFLDILERRGLLVHDELFSPQRGEGGG